MDVGLIPKADNKEVVLHKNGSTDDIMEVVIEATKQKPKKGFCQFAKQFDRSYEGLRDLWSFVKYKIPYRVDPDGRQDILLPSALYERGYGDCKSKTVFIVHVLKCLNIPYVVRFTAYTKGANVSHVYPIAYLNGKYVIVDSVYDFFDREKSYKEKIDYNMTKISMISGLREPDVDDLTKKRLKEIADKQSYVTQQEFLNLSGSIGLSRAQILKRQLELLRAFNADNPKKVTEFNKAIINVDRALTKGVLGYKLATVSGSSDIVSAVNNFINTKLQDPRPTFDYTNTASYQRKIGALPDLAVKYPTDPKRINFSELIVEQNGKRYYRLGAKSKYAVETNKFLNDAIAKFVQQNFVLAKDSRGNLLQESITLPSVLGGQTIQSYVYKVHLDFIRNYTLPLSGSIPAQELRGVEMALQKLATASGGNPYDPAFMNWFLSLFYKNISTKTGKNSKEFVESLMGVNQTKLLTTEFGANSFTGAYSPYETFFSAKFATEDIKTEFEKYIEQESGIYQKYLQQDVFNETGKVGAGVMYDYAMGAQGVKSLNEFPTAVVSKKVTQTGWMDGVQYFTGADSTIVRDLGRNTALFALGENPEDAMTKLYNSTKPAIGCEVACITAIIGAVVTIAGIIADTIVKTKQNATKIEEGTSKSDAINLPTFGPQLMPNESDWEQGAGAGTGGSGTGSGTGGSGTGAGTGMNTNLLLGLGLAGAGAYYLYSKNKKR